MSDNLINYPDIQDDEFGQILNKYEFTSQKPENERKYLYQEPNQLLMRNYISQPTIYDNVLLYHGLGSGKTCTSISIAEGFREYVINLGRRIVVLVKNRNIQRNFINELLSKCTENNYVTDEQRDLYFGVNLPKNPMIQQLRKELINKIHREINKSYHFITYGSFVNQVLGAREYEKDEYGRNTTRVKRVDGEIQRKRSKNAIYNLSNTVVIVDEVHNVTNNDVYTALHYALSRSFNYRLVLLTATPMYDNIKEMFELSNLLNINNPDLQLPIRNDLFKPSIHNKIYLIKQQSELINNSILKGGIITLTKDGREALQYALRGKVSYLKPNEDTNPEKYEQGLDLIAKRLGTSKVVYCKMSKYQYITYLKALKEDVKTDSKYDISTAIQNLESAENIFEEPTVSKTGSLYKNSSDASTMTYPDNMYGKDGFNSVFTKDDSGRLKLSIPELLTTNLVKFSTKLWNLLQNIKNSPGNTFIYSNYVSGGGTSLIKQLLLANGFSQFRGSKLQNSFIMFDESTNIETREKYRRIFNSPENKNGDYVKIIIGSPIISEGITLKNIRQVHILEPSWNMSRVNQIIGRAVRNNSHSDLPLYERKVDIYKYVSLFPSKTIYESSNQLMKFFIDREKYILSEEKDRANKQVERILKELSFDCGLMKNRNTYPPTFNGKSDCDYTNCNFTCIIDTKTPSVIDKSTYNIHIRDFERSDIFYTLNIIRDLFHRNFIWHLNDIISEIHTLEPDISLESIYTTLGHIIQNKVFITDMYNRDGFIINKGEYYIFNASDIDIDSSFYSKILDFSVDKSKYTLEQFVETKFDTSLFEQEVRIKKQKSPVFLSNSDIQYNENIIKSNLIFGTYRQRGTKDNLYGPLDDKFRIVDFRKASKTGIEDKRKNVSGMWIGSYKKLDLIDIAKYLKIKTKTPILKYDKEELGSLIEKVLRESNLVLR